MHGCEKIQYKEPSAERAHQSLCSENLQLPTPPLTQCDPPRSDTPSSDDETLVINARDYKVGEVIKIPIGLVRSSTKILPPSGCQRMKVMCAHSGVIRYSFMDVSADGRWELK